MRRGDIVGAALAAACGAALADALDDALVYHAITARAAEAAVASPRAIEALGGEPIRVGPWWRSSSVSAPLSSSGLRGGGRGNVASASFAVTGPAESGSRSADVVVLAVAARERRAATKGAEEGVNKEKEQGRNDDDGTAAPSSSSPQSPPAAAAATPLPSPLLLLRSLRRRWSRDGWELVSADVTLPRPGGAPGPATGVSLMREIEALSRRGGGEVGKEEEKEKEKK